MTPEEKRRLKVAYAQLSAYYSRPLQDFVLDMYVADLDGLSFAEVMQAIETYRRGPKNRTLPLPSDLRAIVLPRLDPDIESRELASRVLAAVSKFGYANPEEARTYVGEIAWHAIKRWGGWKYVCENLGTKLDVTTFQAQTRDLIKATIVKGGSLDESPKLQAAPVMELLESGNDLNKTIGAKRDHD